MSIDHHHHILATDVLSHIGLFHVSYDTAAIHLTVHIVIYIIMAILFALWFHTDITVLLPKWQHAMTAELSWRKQS